MIKKILFPSLILLTAFLLLAFKSPEKDPRVLSPSVAALVVASKPVTMPDKLQMTADILTQNRPDSEMKSGGYLDTEMPAGTETMAQIPDEAGEHTISNDTATVEEKPVEVPEQTELVASINEIQGIEKAVTDSRTSPDMVYTIQTGSFQNYLYAQDQFDSIMEALGQEELDSLRIETIGKFNAVRLGRFNDFKSAEEFLTEITPRVTDAIILKVHIIDDRITQQLVE